MNAVSPNLDERALRDAFGRFATGVCIITTRAAAGRPVGMTANSFTALSLRPPLLLWCLGLNSTSRTAFEQADRFAVNVLSANQRALSHRFASLSREDRFAGIEWFASDAGMPLLPGTVASFECRRTACHREGDHLIFIGAIESFSHGDGRPLVFASGRYGIAAPHPEEGS